MLELAVLEMAVLELAVLELAVLELDRARTATRSDINESIAQDSP